MTQHVALLRGVNVGGHGVVRTCGLDAPIAYSDLDDLQALVKSSPFSRFAREPDVKLYVAFLVEPPRVKLSLPHRSSKDGLEVVGFQGLDVFLVSRPVKGRYGFPNNFLEKVLGVAATTRNWKTVVKIVQQFGEHKRP